MDFTQLYETFNALENPSFWQDAYMKFYKAWFYEGRWTMYVDGLITDVPGLTLVTLYADCIPLFFLDPVFLAVLLAAAALLAGCAGRTYPCSFLAIRRASCSVPSISRAYTRALSFGRMLEMISHWVIIFPL